MNCSQSTNQNLQQRVQGTPKGGIAHSSVLPLGEERPQCSSQQESSDGGLCSSTSKQVQVAVQSKTAAVNHTTPGLETKKDNERNPCTDTEKPSSEAMCSSQASSAAEAGPELNTTCPCCPKEAKLVCTQCRHQQYCSRDCQISHWKSHHRKECQALVGRTVIVDLDQEEAAAPASVDEKGQMVLKVQVPLNSAVSPMIAYDESRSVMYLINGANCKKAKKLEATVRKSGLVGGAKAYFTAKLRQDQKLVIYIDQRPGNLGW